MSDDGKSTYEVHELPNELARRAGPGSGIPQQSLQRAEKAVAGMAVTYVHELEQQLAALHRDAAALPPQPAAEAVRAVFLRAHDLRGIAGSFGYPMISRIGDSLCRLIEKSPQLAAAELDLIAIHTASMNAVRRQEARGENRTARELAEELEAKVVAQLAAGA